MAPSARAWVRLPWVTIVAVLWLAPHARGQATQPAAPENIIRRSSPAPMPAASQPASGMSSIYNLQRVLIALAAVIALVFLLRWVGRKMLGLPSISRASSVIQVVGRVPMAPRQQLVLVRVGQRLLVLGDSAGQLSTLTEITEADEVAAVLGQLKSNDSSRNFASVFDRSPSAAEVPADASSANDSAAVEPGAPSIEETKRQLSGLSDRIQKIASQFRKT